MISIITPVYNGEKFIGACIQAVIDQNCPDVEHIIVDGRSSDTTIEIVKTYAQQYSHIRWISEQDQGQSDAMNKGIAIANGEIIAMLNVDDYYEPNVLNRVIIQFNTLPEPSFLVGNCNVWDDDGHLIEVNKPAKLRLFDLVLGINVNPYPCNPSAYFYHRSLHEKIGYYPVDDHHMMDLDFILRAIQSATVEYVDETWGNYRRIEGTKTYEDMVKGRAHQRVLSLLKKYRQNLNWFEKTQIKLFEAQGIIKFLLLNPRQASQVLKRKLSSI